jgi:hypothetical protein
MTWQRRGIRAGIPLAKTAKTPRKNGINQENYSSDSF